MVHISCLRGVVARGLALAGLMVLCSCGGGGGGGGDPSTPPPSPVVSVYAGALQLPGSRDGNSASAQFTRPAGVALDSAGNAYVVDNFTIRKITPAGVVTTLAGAAGQSGSMDGTGAAARLAPADVAVDAAGILYVADSNHTVRRISPAGVVTTLAGATGEAGSANGSAANARFRSPSKIAVDAAGNVLVLSDSAVRKITPDGTVTTFAGAPGEPGDATGDAAQSRFFRPSGLAVDAAGNVFVAENSGNGFSPVGSIRKFSSAGQSLPWGSTTALLVPFPLDIEADAAGNLLVVSNGFVTASTNLTFTYRSVLRISPAGEVATVAGAQDDIRSVDGPGTQARFNDPVGVAVGSNGRIVVTEGRTAAIRAIDAQGNVSTLAGGLGAGYVDGPAAAARFNEPKGLAAATDGTLFAVDRRNLNIRKISPAGVVSSLTPSGTASVLIEGRDYIALDRSGTAYVSGTARTTFLLGRQIQAVSPAGAATRLFATAADAVPLAVDPAGNLILPELNTLVVATPAGAKRPLATVGGVSGLATDAAGKVYFATSDGTVGTVDSSGNVQILAGRANDSGTRDGEGSQALFRQPGSVAVDAAGNLYVADLLRVRRITPQGVVSTVADLALLEGVQPVEFGRPIGALAWTGGALYATFANAILRIAPLN